MRFVLCRAVARCQARRLLAAAASAPLPAAILVVLVACAPVAFARVGAMLGHELAPAATASAVATAIVLGPCLAAAAAGGVIAVSLPARAGLGLQIAAGPCGDRSAIVAPLVFPGFLAAIVLLPSLVALTVALGGPLPGGPAGGLALCTGVLAAVPLGALVAEGVQNALCRRTRGLMAVGVGLAAWVCVGHAMNTTPLGPLAPAGLAMRGVVSPWVALVVVAGVAFGLGCGWVGVASHRPERSVRVPRRGHVVAAWRFPVAAAASALVVRRPDVRRAMLAALGFGLIGATVAIVAGSASPGPFLLATTTTLLGSLVAALALFGIVASGSWAWLAAPRSLPCLVARVWLVGLAAAAAPVGVVGAAAAIASGVSLRTAAVVSALVIMGSAIATITGSIVPWQGEGVGDQLGAVATFMASVLAASCTIGLVAPRLTALGLPDPVMVVVLCVSFSLLANAILARRLEGGAR